jgi:hypothetical protein
MNILISFFAFIGICTVPEDKESCMLNIDLYIKPRKCSGCKYYYCEYDFELSSIYPYYEECTIELKYRKRCKEPEYIFYTKNEAGIIKSLWIKLKGILRRSK